MSERRQPVKVFISWSESRSRAAARALRDWIQCVFHNVEPWMSEKDIKAGALWLNEIMHGLKEARFGIVCITPENQLAPWLHFEAGTIAKQVDNSNYVCPYLISLTGAEFQRNPLTYFQYKQADEQGTRDLVNSINELIEKSLDKEVLDKTFTLWWPQLHEELSRLPEPETKTDVQRTSDDMIAEVLETVRRIDNSIAADAAARNTINLLSEPRTLGELFPNISAAAEKEQQFVLEKARQAVLEKARQEEIKRISQEHPIRPLRGN
jgi:TIR domain